MNPFRFTILQLFLVTALVALVAGLVSAAWRATTYQSITHVCFSPSGKYLAASYTSGAVQVWQVDQGRPRLVAKAFGRGGVFNLDYGSGLQFITDEKLLKIKTQIDSLDVRVRQLDVASRQVADVVTIESLAPALHVHVASGNRLFVSSWDTSSVSSYRLEDGKLQRNWSLPAPVQYNSALASQGNTLAVCDQNGQMFLIDVDSDQPPRAMPGSSPFALSSDGRLIATAGKLHGNTLCVRDSASLGAVAEFPRQDLPYLTVLGFTPDSRRLVVADHRQVAYFDLQNKELVRSVEIDESAPPMNGYGVLSPSADRLARYSSNQIVLYNLPSASSWYVLGGDWHLLEIIIFTLGFAGWSVAWGVVAKRERLKQMASAPRTAPIGVAPSFARSAPAPTAWKSKLIKAGLAFVLCVIVLAALEISEARSLSVALWQTFSWLGTVFVMAAGFVVFYATISYFKSGPHHITLVRLKQLTGAPGRLERHGQLTFWFPAYAQRENVHQECLAEVLDRAEAIFGRDVEPQKRRIVVCLERQSELDAYFGRHVPLCSLIPRFVLDRVTLICRETALTQLLTPRQALQAGLAFTIAVEQTGGFIAGWAATILNQQITRDGRRPAEIRSAVRYLKAFMARQPAWDPKSVLLRTPRDRLRIWLGLEERLEWRDVHAETNFLLTLGEILLGDGAPAGRDEKTRAWLRTIKPKDDALATFESQVGLSIDALLTQWRDWLAAQTGLPFDPLPADSRSLLYDIALPTIADERLPIKVRQRMVRQLGSFYAAAAPTLIELLADPLVELRREAIDALELLSGETFGDNTPQWQAWWQSVAPTLSRDQTWSRCAAISSSTPSSPGASLLPAETAGLGAGLPTPKFGAGLPTPEFGAGLPTPKFGAGLPTPPTPPTAGLLPELNPVVPQQPPGELKTCWGLMVAAGLVALVVPISLLFFTGPIVFPMFYYSLFLGVAALARGAARDTRGLPSIAKMQLFNLMLCDPVNGLCGAIEHFLLRREHVKQYLLTINAGRL